MQIEGFWGVQGIFKIAAVQKLLVIKGWIWSQIEENWISPRGILKHGCKYCQLWVINFQKNQNSKFSTLEIFFKQLKKLYLKNYYRYRVLVGLVRLEILFPSKKVRMIFFVRCMVWPQFRKNHNLVRKFYSLSKMAAGADHLGVRTFSMLTL